MRLTTTFLVLALTGSALAQAPANKPATPAPKPVAPSANSKPAQAAPVKPTQVAASKPTQVAPAKTPQVTTTKPAQATTKPATTAVKPVAVAAKPMTASQKPTMTKAPAKPVEKKVAEQVVKPVIKTDKKPETPPAAPAAEAKKSTEVLPNAKNRRDPFVSVVMDRSGGPPCAGGGKKCIAIDQVILQGVVRSPSGPIAVINSGANKTYFLRENDPVYNGVVVKISPDSIIFRETVMDRLGKSSQREVVKKIRNSPA